MRYTTWYLLLIIFNVTIVPKLYPGLSQVRLTVTTEQRSISFDLFTSRNAFIAAAACGAVGALYKIVQIKCMQRAHDEKLKIQQMLLDACFQNDQSLFEKALQAGADINQPFSDGQTILIKAAIADRLWLVQRLMFLCADATIHDAEGKSALMYAQEQIPQNETLIRLVSNRTTKMLWEALLYGTARDMTKAIAAGANIHEADSGGFTLLCNALVKFYGVDFAKIETLFNAGANCLTDNDEEDVEVIVQCHFPQENKSDIIEYIRERLSRY